MIEHFVLRTCTYIHTYIHTHTDNRQLIAGFLISHFQSKHIQRIHTQAHRYVGAKTERVVHNLQNPSFTLSLSPLSSLPFTLSRSLDLTHFIYALHSRWPLYTQLPLPTVTSLFPTLDGQPYSVLVTWQYPQLSFTRLAIHPRSSSSCFPACQPALAPSPRSSEVSSSLLLVLRLPFCHRTVLTPTFLPPYTLRQQQDLSRPSPLLRPL